MKKSDMLTRKFEKRSVDFNNMITTNKETLEIKVGLVLKNQRLNALNTKKLEA